MTDEQRAKQWRKRAETFDSFAELGIGNGQLCQVLCYQIAASYSDNSGEWNTLYNRLNFLIEQVKRGGYMTSFSLAIERLVETDSRWDGFNPDWRKVYS